MERHIGMSPNWGCKKDDFKHKCLNTNGLIIGGVLYYLADKDLLSSINNEVLVVQYL